MHDAQDLDVVALQAVDNEIWQRGDNQFTRAGNFAEAAHIGEANQILGGGLDPGYCRLAVTGLNCLSGQQAAFSTLVRERVSRRSATTDYSAGFTPCPGLKLNTVYGSRGSNVCSHEIVGTDQTSRLEVQNTDHNTIGPCQSVMSYESMSTPVQRASAALAPDRGRQDREGTKRLNRQGRQERQERRKKERGGSV